MENANNENIPYEDMKEIEIPYNLNQYLSSEQCNLQSLCRICLSTGNEAMYPLLESKENSLLAAMYTDISSVQLAEDEIPSCICEACQIQVVHCYEFRSKCIKSDCILKSILKFEFLPKEETADIVIDIKEETSHNDFETFTHTVKDETDLVEDVQYLDEFSDDASHEDALQIIHEHDKRGKGKRRKVHVAITDSKSLLKEFVEEQKHSDIKNKTYRCTLCPKTFIKADSFRTHMRMKHAKASCPYPCEKCSDSFNSEHDLWIHASVHTKGPKWKCIQCHKEFDARVRFRRHIKRHMETKQHACTHCGKLFTELYAMRRHARVHTGETIEKKHACHICDKRYSSSSLLASHLSSRHIGLRPCKCGTCGKAFSSPRLLASHALIHTDRKQYACAFCNRRFRHESTLITHRRTHTGEKPYVCSACGKSFIQNSNLTLHMRTHTGERPYTCSICDRKFTSGSTLKSHQRTHSGERPYSCEICGKKFSRVNMTAHMRLHSGDRPFACTVCPKKFINASRLRDHCRIHTGEKPFECAVCSRKCATKTHLVRHMKTHQTKNKKASTQNLEQANIIFKEHSKSLANDVPKKISVNPVPIEVSHEVPLHVTGELVVQDDDNVETEYLVVNTQNNDYQSDNICVNGNNVNIISNDISSSSDVNLVTVNDGEVSISTSNVEGTTVKLYQLDQSLVQIHSSAGQVTISKITSKMTANF